LGKTWFMAPTTQSRFKVFHTLIQAWHHAMIHLVRVKFLVSTRSDQIVSYVFVRLYKLSGDSLDIIFVNGDMEVDVTRGLRDGLFVFVV